MPVYMVLYAYTHPIDIHCGYNGIKYQASNQKSGEPINIEIKGKYVRELFTNNMQFDGTIKIGDKVFDERPRAFNKNKMALLESIEGHYGMIFVDSNFQKLTIEILEPVGNGGYTWNDKTGWMISAPCNDRVEAVKISNMLEQKLLGHEIQ